MKMIRSGEFDRIARMMFRMRWWMKRLEGMLDGDLDGVADKMSDRDDGFECLTGMLAEVFDSGRCWLSDPQGCWMDCASGMI